MDIRTYYIPKSKRGRKAARLLVEWGIIERQADALGRYVCNVAPNLTFEQARHLAYALDPEAAETAEADAYDRAERILDNPVEWGVPANEAAAAADEARTLWPFGR